MSFSAESLVKMADNRSKYISEINVNDYVLDMFLKPCKVTKKRVITNCTSYNISLNNSTGSFYVNKNQLVRSLMTTETGKVLKWDTIEHVFDSESELKSNSLIKSVNAEINISSLNTNTTPRTLYHLTLDNKVKSFFVNNVIVQSQ